MTSKSKATKPLPISNTGLGRTRGGLGSGGAPAQTAAPAQDAQVKNMLEDINGRVQKLAQQPIKPILRPINPMDPLE
jgi:hypothetical protein